MAPSPARKCFRARDDRRRAPTAAFDRELRGGAGASGGGRPDAAACGHAIAALGIRLVPPTAEIARAAARHRRLGISLADGFAIATAEAHSAAVATFDRRVRRGLRRLGVELAVS
ncbi:PIN domain-containing protein [Conexibacter woesei]|uniref:PIN domain-containing protein n=1 Tax=Conexibacter woesei TaxID=191495 RepID=UPI0009D780F2|nr:PIN domain-containing protein [Conexibacter woesei]